jgi:isochorismate hydrolase
MLVSEQQKLGRTVQEICETLKDYAPVSKLEFDCFGSQDFRQRIGTFKQKTLIVVGIEAHICVAQTALHALPDYKVHVVSDAVSSRTIDNKKVALFRMGQAGATITSTEMVMYELLGKAGTDTFREVLKLVK